MAISQHSPASLLDYVAVLRRRWLLIASATVLVAGIAFIVSTQESKVYRASAEVLLNRQDLGSALTGTPDPSLSTDPVRLAQTQVGLARLPEVARRAVAKAGVQGRSRWDLLSHSSVHTNVDSDILTFNVDDGDPSVAARLATAYAHAFTEYRLELATDTFRNARLELERRLAALGRDRSSPLYRSLTEKIQQLRTMELLQDPSQVVKAAEGAAKVRPTPKRNAVIGALFGVLLGGALAFLWEAFDKRVRSEREIQERLGLPLLGSLPPPARHRGGRVAMLADPASPEAEAVRKLRINLEFANLDLNARAILVSSAMPQEGKSTTAANIAVALARGGHDVALLDLDLRQPTLAPMFELPARIGVTDVALGRATLEQALVPVVLGRPVVTSMANGRGGLGTLSVLPAGTLPANPGEFVATDALARVIAEVRMRHEFVIVDAPPMCVVGDAMALSAHLDAIVAVARLGSVDRPMLEEFARELAAVGAPKLGLVLTGADSKLGYGDYFRYESRARVSERPPAGRTKAL